MSPTKSLREKFAVTFETPIQWGEMDAFQHVNNLIYLRWFESVRIEYFLRTGVLEDLRETNHGPILKSSQIRYRYPLSFPGKILAGTNISKIASDRVEMNYQIVGLEKDVLAAEGSTEVVWFDFNKQRPTNISDKLLGQFKKLNPEVESPQVLV